MSTFFEFVGNLLSLNFGWVVNFLLSNLFWLFAHSLLVHILFGGKMFFRALIFLTFALWLWNDFGELSGVGFVGAQIISVYYISKIAILTFVENTPSLKNHLLVISTVTGLVSLVLANIFL